MQRFLGELKRRRVLHTASFYVVGAWIALQVVDVLSDTLPAGTTYNLIVLLTCGFPLALVTGWFFDITKEGISKTGPLPQGEQPPEVKFIDHVLLAGLLVVVVVDVYILSFPPPGETPVVNTPTSQQRTIAILGFEDLTIREDEDAIGDVFAGELRSSLTRVAGLKVLGPETSKLLQLAGDNRLVIASELSVTAMVLGEVLLDAGQLLVKTRLVGVPSGAEIWSTSIEGAIGDAVSLQQRLLKQMVGAIAPGLDPDPVQGFRAEAGDCSAVYDIYLRGKQLSMARKQTQAELYQRGMELLREAVAIDENCAIAWEAIAVGSMDLSMPGYVKASAAARRALELNDALPEAWSVLAKIAEEEMRWMDSEEYFLRALYADPTNVHANQFYGETLLVRGRVKEGLQHTLEAYRYDPASVTVNNHVGMAAARSGDGDLTVKHARIFGDLMGLPEHWWVLGLLAEGYLLNGEIDKAVETLDALGFGEDDWYSKCARAREEPDLVPEVLQSMRVSMDQYKSGTLDKNEIWPRGNALFRCGTWLEQPDIVFDLLSVEGVPPFVDGLPTEVKFINLFFSDAKALRQDPRFRQLVVDTGLLEYWRKFGWSDYCEPEGDSFRCD